MIIKRKKQGQTANVPQPETAVSQPQAAPKTENVPFPPKKEISLMEEISLVDVSTVEFEERFERRRGDRRRGYRRIDERTLVSRAQEEAQSIRLLAAKEGYKNGMEEANSQVESLKTSIEEFLSMKTQVYEEISKDILEIALEVAKKIIKKEVDMSEDVLKCVLQAVLDEVSVTEQKVTVKVSPQELDFAKASLPELLSNSQMDAKIVVISDDTVEKGSCIVITNNGIIDANFSTQLSIVQNAFGIYKGGQ